MTIVLADNLHHEAFTCHCPQATVQPLAYLSCQADQCFPAFSAFLLGHLDRHSCSSTAACLVNFHDSIMEHLGVKSANISHPCTLAVDKAAMQSTASQPMLAFQLNPVLQELEERYNRLRLEFQLAVDKAESVTEPELVRRALSKEKGTAQAKGFFGAAAKYAVCLISI